MKNLSIDLNPLQRRVHSSMNNAMVIIGWRKNMEWIVEQAFYSFNLHLTWFLISSTLNQLFRAIKVILCCGYNAYETTIYDSNTVSSHEDLHRLKSTFSLRLHVKIKNETAWNRQQ